MMRQLAIALSLSAVVTGCTTPVNNANLYGTWRREPFETDVDGNAWIRIFEPQDSSLSSFRANSDIMRVFWVEPNGDIVGRFVTSFEAYPRGAIDYDILWTDTSSIESTIVMRIAEMHPNYFEIETGSGPSLYLRQPDWDEPYEDTGEP